MLGAYRCPDRFAYTRVRSRPKTATGPRIFPSWPRRRLQEAYACKWLKRQRANRRCIPDQVLDEISGPLNISCMRTTTWELVSKSGKLSRRPGYQIEPCMRARNAASGCVGCLVSLASNKAGNKHKTTIRDGRWNPFPRSEFRNYLSTLVGRSWHRLHGSYRHSQHLGALRG